MFALNLFVKLYLSCVFYATLYFKNYFTIFKITNMYGDAYAYSAGGGQKKVMDPLKLKLQSVVSYLMWVTETKLRSS